MKPIFIYLVVLNIVTFLIFGYDKWQAKQNKQRISERNLFTFVFFGGTIGGFLGMRFFKHKTKKTSFLLVFYGILLFQIGLFYVWKRYF